MSTRYIIIIILVVLLAFLHFRNNNFTTYELKGKVTMTNACTNNTADLTDKIRIKARLFYQDTTATPDNWDKNNIPAPVTDPSTREAMYSLKSTTNMVAKQWKIDSIISPSGSDICTPISCTSPQTCENRSTVVGDPYTVPVPSGQNVVTKDYTISCACGPRSPPTPPPTLTPFPTDSPDDEF